MCRNRNGTITLKLADFGLAMEVTDPIFTVCGTPTYVAPEILSEIGTVYSAKLAKSTFSIEVLDNPWVFSLQ